MIVYTDKLKVQKEKAIQQRDALQAKVRSLEVKLDNIQRIAVTAISERPSITETKLGARLRDIIAITKEMSG